MPHKNQKFLTCLLLLSGLWLFLLLEPVVFGITGAKCARLGEPPLQLTDCTRVMPAEGPLPDGIETLVLVIAAAGLLLSAAASFELARKNA